MHSPLPSFFKIRNIILILWFFLLFFNALSRWCFAGWTDRQCFAVIGKGDRDDVAGMYPWYKSITDNGDGLSANLGSSTSGSMSWLVKDWHYPTQIYYFDTTLQTWVNSGATLDMWKRQHPDIWQQLEAFGLPIIYLPDDFMGFQADPQTCPIPSCNEKTGKWVAYNCQGNSGSYDCATDTGKCDPNPCDSSVDSDGDTYDQCRDCDDDNASRTEGCLQDKQQGQPNKCP